MNLQAGRRFALTLAVLLLVVGTASAQTPPPTPDTTTWKDVPVGATCVFSWGQSSLSVYVRTPGGDTKVADQPVTPETMTWRCVDAQGAALAPGVYGVSIAIALNGVDGPRGPLIPFIVEPFPAFPPPASLIVSGDATSNNLVWVNTAPNATGLRIYRKAESCSTSTPIMALADNLPPEATAYTDTPVGPGTWCYEVTAFNDTGESARSYLAERTIPAPKPVIAIGATVQTTTALYVRTSAGKTAPYADPLHTYQAKGARGVIVDGPVVVPLPAPATTWWKLDYATGPDGWSSQGPDAAPYLVLVP